MSTLTLLRGYPASGKTTAAKSWLAAQPGPDEASRARVSRDDLRATLFAAAGVLTYAQEQHITDVQQDTVRKLLKRGYDVVVDDLNLRRRYAVEWARIARDQQAGFNIWDIETPINECMNRDTERFLRGQRSVSNKVIGDIAAKFPLGRWPSHEEIMAAAAEKRSTTLENVVPYVADVGKPPVYIVDLDGTVALKSHETGSRGWHEYHRVGEDLPNQPVIQLVQRLRKSGAGVVFLSGRKNTCQQQTTDWLFEHLGPWILGHPLFMRAADDNRDDSIVKLEIFDAHIRDTYQVLGCIDDRDRVVAMWRSLGLTCFQVAEGAF